MISFFVNGVMRGYPTCCISMFIRRVDEFRINGKSSLGTPFLTDEGVSTGYLMCDECAKLPRQQLIDSINATRAPHYEPFPAVYENPES